MWEGFTHKHSFSRNSSSAYWFKKLKALHQAKKQYTLQKYFAFLQCTSQKLSMKTGLYLFQSSLSHYAGWIWYHNSDYRALWAGHNHADNWNTKKIISVDVYSTYVTFHQWKPNISENGVQFYEIKICTGFYFLRIAGGEFPIIQQANQRLKLKIKTLECILNKLQFCGRNWSLYSNFWTHEALNMSYFLLTFILCLLPIHP